MSVAISARENILDNIVSALAAIAADGSSYNYTPGLCQLGLLNYAAVPEDKFPALFVAGADEKRSNNTNMEFRSDLTVSVVGYVKASDAADSPLLERQLSRLIRDVTKRLMLDVTRGGYATFTQIEEIDTDKGSWEGFAGFEMTVRCQYRAASATP